MYKIQSSVTSNTSCTGTWPGFSRSSRHACWTSCSISRMRLLDLSRTHGNTIISLLFFEICTGSQIRQRIVFKLATMVYKCQHGLCPSYLAEDCILLSATRGRQHLRSAGRLELLVPRTRTVTFGPRAFAVAGPGVWNSLPPALREPTLSFNCFRRGLKTFLFR